MNSFLIKSGLLVCAASSHTLSAQLAATAEPVYQLKEYVVSAGPVARSIEDYSSPFTSLDAADIQQEGGSSLGALLDGQPGVTATSFGGGASRPIIRGFDGPRVRILESGLGSLDVSETSPDHAVSVEPLLIDRIEILRGPSTLLYGSSAIGGVVNVMGKEIPRERVDPKAYEGAIETRYDSVSNGETHLGYGTVGGENWTFSLTGLKRNADNYEIAGDAEAIHEEEEHHDDDDDHNEEAHEEESGDELASSFVETESYSAGGTWFFGEHNYIGASFSVYDSYYGVPGHEHEHHDEDDDDHDDDHEEEEESVAIDLERKRFDLELALFDPIDWIEAARFRFGYTDYQHTELEGDETGTVFSRDGWELRGEIAHREWAFIDEGIFGIQTSDTDFEAQGEEGAAFGPATQTSNQAIFINEQIHRGAWHYEFGGRLETQQIDAKGVSDYSDVAMSLAAGIIYTIDTRNSLALSLQRSQRHPTSTELYADGEHIATSQYELGDDDLGLETAYGIDLSYRFQGEQWEATASIFYTYFDDYIYAAESDATALGIDTELDTYAYDHVDANFYGFEAELERILYRSEESELRIGIMGDYVRAENRDSSNDLPRIPPLRLGGKIQLAHGNWDAGLRLRHAFDQNDTAPLETETDGYTELKANLAYTFLLGNGIDLTIFAQADNLLDEVIRNHTSYIKDVAPLPGRNVTIGARLQF
ncbi:TonB-dependent receptor [Coraliomargarita sp. SDUM461004]|uniref:TonB-dependent receptor n=1 Tax=Thalassobacterium sedimentorum TaxID=3041258 RepID=A0ABU1AI08_9BACT|nr:TonB-dependent receptor [Coraliomargarita sp. SDUM461004]MDQ8194447.1 TonB-dependent receptor [Coraliomargarita sp. SDUM461004]